MSYTYEQVHHLELFPAKILLQDLKDKEVFIPPHWHRSLEIDHILEGHIKGIINGRGQELIKGDLFFVNSGDIHTIKPIKHHAKAITILVSYDFLKGIYPELDSVYFNIEKQSELEAKIIFIIKTIGQLYETKEDFFHLKITALLYDLIFLLLKDCKIEKNHSISVDANHPEDRIKEILEYINCNYQSEELNLNQISDYFSLSPAYFSRYFKNKTGITFKTYVDAVRLHVAFKDLLNSTLSITDIAMKHGFPNVKTFITLFKKKYQLTPNEYRKNHTTTL